MALPGSPKSERLDLLLVARGLAATRVKAQALVMAGRVHSNGVRLDKAGTRIAADAPLEVTPAARYVSRGGPKLEGALSAFGILPKDRQALDVGASTGGFTEVLLAAGAACVVALDVGHGQLDAKLRAEPRVIPLEGINARYLQPEQLPFRPSLAVVDVSFISLERILPSVLACLVSEGEIVALIKPQFEVGRGRVGRGGVVRDPKLHREVLLRIVRFAATAGASVLGLARSSLPGAEGNVEFFVHLAPHATGLAPEALERRIEELVAEAAP